jgi:TolB-like protein/tetratricopeptide (TPR) repeat protein
MNFRYLLLVALLVAVASAWIFWLGHPATNINTVKSMETAGNRGANRLYFGPPRSIAVLPFTDESPKQDQAYLAHGLAAELTRLLTGFVDLQVTARQSAWFFRDSEVRLATIGERLQTAHLLRGGTRMDAGRLFVRVELFDSRRERSLWSAQFERETTAVFALQEEVLAAVVAEVLPGGGPWSMAVEAIEPEAWLHYLRGLEQLDRRTTDGFAEAAAAFGRAVELAADYEPALLGLAEANLAAAQRGGVDFASAGTARELIAGVLAVDPDSAAALGLQSYIRRNLDWEWAAAEEAARQAVDLRPGDASLLSIHGLALFSLGRFGEAVERSQAALARDPLNLHSRLRLGLLQEFAGDLEEALTTYRVIVRMNPDYPGVHALRARVKLLQGKPESALAESEQETDPFWSRYSRILALDALGRPQQSEPLLARMIEEDGDRAAYQVAEILARRGATDQAFAWLERARAQRDSGLAELLGNAILAPLHGDPRWAALLEALRLPLDAAAR